MDSLRWQGSAVPMPAAGVCAALTEPGSPWDECWEMVLFIFSFCFEVPSGSGLVGTEVAVAIRVHLAMRHQMLQCS